MVPVPPLPAVKVSEFEFNPFAMVIVWPMVGPAFGVAPEKVPVACAPVALDVRLSTFPLTPLVMVIVGVVAEVGTPETVPMALAVVPPLLRVRVFEPLTSVIWVLATGTAVPAVPTTVRPVPLVVKVNVLAPYPTVIALPVAEG
jgi:hypothetical protein